MIFSIDAEKVLYKIEHPFLIKTVHCVRLEGTYLICIKAILKKTHSKYHPKQGKTEIFYPKFKNTTGMSTLTTVVQHNARSLSLGNKNFKKIKK